MCEVLPAWAQGRSHGHKAGAVGTRPEPWAQGRSRGFVEGERNQRGCEAGTQTDKTCKKRSGGNVREMVKCIVYYTRWFIHHNLSFFFCGFNT